MTRRPVETTTPPNSLASKLVKNSSFHDSWSVSTNRLEFPALDHFLHAAERTPHWVDKCMRIRNFVGRLVGLKDLGSLSGISNDKPASEYRTGDRVGIFTVVENTFDEALIGDDDKHLAVTLSIHRKPPSSDDLVTVTVTTVVHIKNALGRFYMVPVKPMHRLITPAVLSMIGSDRNGEE